MPRSSEAKEKRLPVVERMLEDNVSPEEIAKAVGTTSRTIYNDIAALKAKGHIKDLRREMPKTQEGRDTLIVENVKTLDTVRWLINEGTSMLEFLKEWMGVPEHDKCKVCGCLGRHKSAQDFMAVAKVMDSLTNSLTLLAKVLGEITDSPIINVLQADQDVNNILAIVVRGDELIAAQLTSMDKELVYIGEQVPMFRPHVERLRERISTIVAQPVSRHLHQELTASARRAQRLGGYQSAREQALLGGGSIEGEYREV